MVDGRRLFGLDGRLDCKIGAGLEGGRTFFYLRTIGQTRTSLASFVFDGDAQNAVSRYADLGSRHRLQRALRQFYAVFSIKN